MQATAQTISQANGVRVVLPALYRPKGSSPTETKLAPVIPPSALPSADYSLRGLRSTDTMGALDDSPAPVGEIFQEQLCLQRLLALFSHEIRWLRRSGAHELDVILRPDPGTRIALHVVWCHGGFEAEARCEEGDYPVLNARWSELQYRLEGQAFRLGPLAPPAVRVEFPTGLQVDPLPRLPAPVLAA